MYFVTSKIIVTLKDIACKQTITKLTFYLALKMLWMLKWV